MKRISAILLIFALSALMISPALAGAYNDALPLPEPIAGVEDIGSTPALLFDVDTGAVLFDNRSDAGAKPGSLTTVMTALLLIENTDPGEWDTPLKALKEVNSSWSRRGAQMGLEKGMTPTRRDLLNALLLQGAADASFVTSSIISGSETAFVSLMNEKAASLGMNDTHFDNGFGLGSGAHYTTAFDMSLLVSEAMKNDIFVSSVRQTEHTCSAGCGGIRLVNSNTALGSNGCIGLKFGGDSEKEHSVIIVREAGSLRLAAVILEAPYDSAAYSFADRLISAGFSEYAKTCGYFSFLPTNAVYTAKSGARLLSSPGGAQVSSLQTSELLNVCGSHSENDTVWLLVYHGGAYLWINADEAEFSCYNDDILIENGPELSSEKEASDPLNISAYFTTRHSVRSVKITLSLPDGAKEFERTRRPNVHGWSTLRDTSVSEDLSSLSLTAGIYTCTVEVTAEAAVPGQEPMTFVKSNSSILSVGTGGACVSYNANGGENAPRGECFFDSFGIPNETPDRFGMEFDGWCASPSGSAEKYMPGDVVQHAGSLTLYAVWKEAQPSWDVDLRVYYTDSLILEGFVKNPGGISGMRLVIEGKDGTVLDETSPVHENEAAPGAVFLTRPVSLNMGDYTVSVYASSVGKPLEIVSQLDLSVKSSGNEATPAPIGSETPAVTPAPSGNGFSFLSIPIAVWFVIGALVVLGLIAAIIIIIKHG